MNLRNLVFATFMLGVLTAGLITSSRAGSATSVGQLADQNGNLRPGGVGEKTTVPFRGTIQGSDTTVPPNIMMTAGLGVAAHLGRFTLTQRAELNFAELTDEGTARWVAANGDSIETYFSGWAIFNETGDAATITEDHVITGGTGRFAGTEGSFTVVRTHLFALSDDGTHITFGTFEGMITAQGAAE